MGEVLTANTSGISDVDGLDSVSFSYQWLSSRDTEISGATNDSYALVSADEGKYIKVRVSFTDDAANAESLTSAATATVAAAPNSPATGAPAVTGTAQVGETLTADTSGIADADRLTNVSYSYQWIANDGTAATDITGATDSTYTLVSADEGKTIKVRVSFTDDADNGETLTSMPTAVVAAPAQVDSENEPSELSHLTVVVTEDDSDPDDVVSTFTITWNDAEDCSSSYNAYLDGVVGEPIHLGSAASEGEQIAGSLTNVSAEAFGFNVKLHCGTIGSDRLVDRLWIPEYSRSFGTLPISRAYLPKPGTYSTEPGLIALTVSSGTLTPAFHNQTLNYTVPDVPNADGRFTLTTTAKADYYTVAFLPGTYHTFFSVCSYGGQQTSLFYGDDAGNQIYPLTDADANTPGFQMDLDEGENVFYIRVWPNCQTGQLYKLTVTRAANAPANTPATGAPTIGGTARVGQTLTADTTGIADSDGLENATFAYQWLADDTDIADATDSTYTLVAAAEGKTIKVRVSFTDDADNDETLTSAATGEVEALPNRPATGAPTISGTAQVWEALTADTSGIADDDGLNNVSYSYQWIRNDGSSDTDITDATGSTYPLAADDEGQTIKVKVTFTDDADNEETLTSDATAEVAAAAPTEPPGRPRNLTGTANSDGTVTLSWDAPNDDSVTGYQILRRRPREGESTLLVHVNDTGSTAAEYTDNGVTPDVGHAYRVKAINAVGLSRQSNFVSITPTQPAEPAQNTSATGLPTIGGTAQVGETLTADTSGIADADGLTKVSYSYQWIPNDGNSDTDNQDAPGSTYTLVDADEGKTIKVEVSFTDDAGNGESLTSAATAEVAARPNTPATGTPTISGTANVGETLTADTSGIADADGLTNVSYGYQWIPNDGSFDTDNQDAPGSTYTLADSDEGKTIKVRVSFTDDAGNEESLTSAATATVASSNPAAGICDRTEQVQDAILGRLNGVVDDCADVTDSHLAGITIGLRISNDPYDRPALSLKSGDFAGLVNIEVLAIYYHTMDALPDDIFEGLTGLNHLYLVENQLGALPEGVFNGLGSLESLDLRGNQLGALPEGVFNGLGSLESLDLRGNQLGALPEGVFNGLGSLESLDLNDNEIAALPEDVFEGLGSLTYLDLRGNQLGALPEGVFNGLGNLTYLWLSFNQLSALPDDVFDDLGNLEQLYLFKNQLGALPEGVFNGLSSLERLNLSYNEIAALPEDVFDGLGNLKSLRLDSNDLASPPEDVFDGLDSLTHLTLSHNRIHTLPEDVFEGLGNLTSLGLGGNQLGALPEDVFDELGNLTSLGLGGNQLGALPEGVFDELGNLTSLDLGNNRIGRLAEDFFDELGNLTSLDLSGNRLGAVPEGFFDELGNLTYLSLYRNQIRALPEDVFEGLGNLTSLNLHANQISVLPEDVFDGLGNLNKLYLNENQLSALPEDVFDGLSNLNELYLFENQLSALPEDVFDGLSNLNELYLYGNQLSALPEDVFDGLSNLNGLYLWGNPGTPFTLTTDLERQGDNAVLVKVAEGVPFDMAVTLSATGGTLSAASVTIKGGTADSEAVTVTRSGDGPVTVSVVSAVFQAGDYNGIQAGLGEPLILGDAEGDNRPATGTPAISGIAQVGETLTADTAGIADADGLTNVTYSYQWIVNDGTADTDIADATDSTYTLVAAAEGKTIKVRVSFTDDADNDETLTSAATGEVEALPNRPATGAPTISGTAQVWEALTADTSGIADDDGLNNVSYSYQWIRNDGSSDTDITDATGSTYPLAADDEGQTIKVKVTFTDDADNEETLTSDATAEVAAAAPTEPPGRPRNLTGTANSDGTVTLSWDAPNDDSVTGYQILRRRPREGESTLLVHVNDTGSTAAEYTDNGVTPDVGHAYRVKAINAVGLSRQSNFVSITPTQPAEPAQNTSATGLPTIGGTAQVGETLTADTSGIADADGLTKVSYSYQWVANDGGTDADISGETDATYTLVAADEGKTIKVRVSFTDDAGNDESLTSAATDEVGFAVQPQTSNNPATGAPTISGTAQVGQTLTADTSGIADDDGLTNVSYGYQWVANDGGTDADIFSETDATYTLVAADMGKTIKVKVSFTDDAENEESLISAATAAVAAADPPAPPTGLSAVVVAHDAVTLIWDDPEDDAITGYVILRRDREIHPVGTFVTIAGDTGSADTTYTDDTVEPDKQYVYRIKAINEHGEVSEESDWVRGFTPAAPPTDSPATGQPAISGTAQVGETLTADTSGIADADGLVNAVFSYQWVAGESDITDATDSTYTLLADDEGQTIKVRVTFTDDAENETTLTSAATEAVEAAPPTDSPATGQPTITGRAQVGQTLTVDTAGIADADGLNSAVFAYQWLSDDAEIGGATGSTYTLVDDAEGRTIKVRVTFTDDAENETTLTSAAMEAVEAAPPTDSPATGQPTITGTVPPGW